MPRSSRDSPHTTAFPCHPHLRGQRQRHVWRGALGRVLQVWRRVQGAMGARADKDFTMKGHQSIRMDITPRRFLELCLAENAHRLDRYDARLLRPRLVPTIARALCKVLP